MDALLKQFLPPRSGTSVCAHRKCGNLLAYELELPWCGTKLKWQVSYCRLSGGSEHYIYAGGDHHQSD
jgi:hypothetical protein